MLDEVLMRIKLATPLIGEFLRYATVTARNLRLNNGVHPDTGGYQQIGDALWAFLKCNA